MRKLREEWNEMWFTEKVCAVATIEAVIVATAMIIYATTYVP